MMDTRSLEELAARLTRVLPPGLGPLRRELKDNFRAVLQSQLPRLELVGREEFEASREMLAHTRRQLESLEAEVKALEKRLAE